MNLCTTSADSPGTRAKSKPYGTHLRSWRLVFSALARSRFKYPAYSTSFSRLAMSSGRVESSRSSTSSPDARRDSSPTPGRRIPSPAVTLPPCSLRTMVRSSVMKFRAWRSRRDSNRSHSARLTRPISRPRGVSRKSALSILNSSRCSALEVNMRYGSRQPLVIRSSTIMPMYSFITTQNERRLTAGFERGICARDETLGSRLLVTGGAVESARRRTGRPLDVSRCPSHRDRAAASPNGDKVWEPIRVSTHPARTLADSLDRCVLVQFVLLCVRSGLQVEHDPFTVPVKANGVLSSQARSTTRPLSQPMSMPA